MKRRRPPLAAQHDAVLRSAPLVVCPACRKVYAADSEVASDEIAAQTAAMVDAIEAWQTYAAAFEGRKPQARELLQVAMDKLSAIDLAKIKGEECSKK